MNSAAEQAAEQATEAADAARDAEILSAARWNLYDLVSGDNTGAAYYARRDFERLSVDAQQKVMRDVAALGIR